MKHKHYVLVVAGVSFAAINTAGAGEVENQVRGAMKQLASKATECKAAIKDALGTPFEKQIQKALDDLKKDPRSLKAQLQVVDILMAQADKLQGSLQSAKTADLVGMRDRVVKGLEALADSKNAEKQRLLTRANESKDAEWKQRYNELSEVCDRLAKAYTVRAEQYRAVPIAGQLFQVQTGIEYLSVVKEVLVSLREGLNGILEDDEALRELQRLSVTVESIQNSLKAFSEVVLAGALAGEEVTSNKP